VSEPVLVCPPDERLLSRLRRRAVVVRLDDPARLPALAALVRRGNQLHAVWLTWPDSVAALPVSDAWASIPLTVHAATLGPIRDLAPRLPLLRHPGIKVLLSSDHDENYVDAGILASLRVHSGIFFGKRPIRWDRLGTLLHYAVYSRARHAPVEPFDYVIARYDPSACTAPGGAWFDDPAAYLHLDADGRVALSADALAARVFAADTPQRLDAAAATVAAGPRAKARREAFVRMDACSCCPGWRICLGAFQPRLAEGGGCRTFFSDLLDAADWQRRLRNGNGGAPCP
jgi:hypothetical protein